MVKTLLLDSKPAVPGGNWGQVFTLVFHSEVGRVRRAIHPARYVRPTIKTETVEGASHAPSDRRAAHALHYERTTAPPLSYKAFMPNYRRARVAGGTYFFTVKCSFVACAERTTNLKKGQDEGRASWLTRVRRVV